MSRHTNAKTIVFSANTTWYLYNFRFPLIKSLLDRGHRIIALSPSDSYEKYLSDNGVKHFHIRMKRGSINPIDDLVLLYKFTRIYSCLKPDIVQHFTAKPVIYGSLAAKLTHVNFIFNMIPGLGYVFTGRNLKKAIIKNLITAMYRRILKYSNHVFFQNTDDKDYFLRHHLVNENNISVVPGTGVDTEFFAPIKKQRNQTVTFLVMARMLWEKGIEEFVEAARALGGQYKNSSFWLLGPVDNDNPMGIPSTQLTQWTEEGAVQYLGMTDDVKSFMSKADVVVLPSYYREGIPLSLLEASAMGMPIITTDSVGCREVVIDGENGFLIPIKNPEKLAAAMEKFIQQPFLIEKMGRRSRQRAVKMYDSKKIVAQILKYYPIQESG
jgi:glycosyltransferase involved in cell wall biosynthesis